MLNKTIAAAALSVSLLFAAPAHAQDKPLKISSGQNVKGAANVTVGAFTVGFVFESVDKKKASGGLIGAFGGATNAKSVLTGVSAETMQAITDAAYADFTQQLTASGFSVSAPDAMFAHANFAGVKTFDAPYEHKIDLDKNSNAKVTFYKPRAMKGILFMPGDVTQNGFGGVGFNMAVSQNVYKLSQYTKASGQNVIDVIYLIDFSQVKRPGAFSFGGLQVNSGMAVVDDYSKLNLLNTSGKLATLTVNTPVAVEGDFASKADTTGGFNSASQKVGNVAGGLMSAFGGLGGMKLGKSKTFTFTAKDAYKDGAIKAATLANARLVTQLAALK